MEVIVNNKTLDNGMNIIQLEQAVGAAIKSFNDPLIPVIGSPLKRRCYFVYMVKLSVNIWKRKFKHKTTLYQN